MKMIIKIIAFLLLAVIIVICCFGVNLYAKTHRDKSTAGKEATTFTTDGSRGTRITNIPFDDYITPSEADENAVIPDIGESLSGEENSAAINSAVKSLPSGSTIYIPPGEYKVSTIVLKSNMTLFISSGAKLVSLSYDENAGSKSPLNKAVIYALGAENITITGGGAICGSGESYTDSAEAEEPLYALNKFNMYTRVIESRRRIRMAKEDAQRSNIILLEECTNSVIENIVLEESAEWTCVLRNCRGATIKNIIIDNNLHVANSDGIDIVNSSNISISSCFIATGDDAVVLKSPEGEISNVTVENCVLSSFANCFKIGTETRFDVNNVSVKDCMFFYA